MKPFTWAWAEEQDARAQAGEPSFPPVLNGRVERAIVRGNMAQAHWYALDSWARQERADRRELLAWWREPGEGCPGSVQ
jgi:hypothetical protein